MTPQSPLVAGGEVPGHEGLHVTPKEKAELLSALDELHEPPGLFLVVNMRLEPVPKARARVRAGQGGYTPPRVVQAENDVALMCRTAMRGEPAHTERLGVALHFDCSTRRRSDLDNLAKLVLDAGNGIVWADDSQIDELRLSRALGVKPPRIRLEVWTA